MCHQKISSWFPACSPAATMNFCSRSVPNPNPLIQGKAGQLEEAPHAVLLISVHNLFGIAFNLLQGFSGELFLDWYSCFHHSPQNGIFWNRSRRSTFWITCFSSTTYFPITFLSGSVAPIAAAIDFKARESTQKLSPTTSA